jgi:microcystin-dependent protein
MPVSINNTTLTFNDGTTMTTAASSPIPAGTVMLFYQNAAPTGWTIVTTQNNKALRVVSGSGGVAGGTTAFSSVFTNQTVSTSISVSGTTGATTLSTSQIPSHSHSTNVFNSGAQCGDGLSNVRGFSNTESSNTGGGGSHTHSFSGSGSGTSSAVTLNVQYIDIILCSKN